jgi:TorA maturation chaperone TorD
MRYPSESWLDTEYFAVLQGFLEELPFEASKDLRFCITSDADWLEKLQIEYTRLFINSYPKVAAPPYASVYLNDDAMLYGKSAEKVRTFYRARGVDLVADSDMPDHLCLQLDFLALLADGNMTEDESLFLATHFRPWFGLFRKRVHAAAQLPFYTILVDFIEFITREEN